jgi:hypothetical protein
MRTLDLRLLVVGAGIYAGACGGGGAGVAPTAPTTSSAEVLPPAGKQPVRILSGGNGKPVVGAIVSVNYDDNYASDGNGNVVPGPYSDWPMGAAIDVDASGYLPRRTTVPGDRVVTLWPVADGTEADAVREMVYGQGEVLYPHDSGPLTLSVLDADYDLAAVWEDEAAAFGAPFHLTYNLSHNFQYDPDEIAVRFARTGECDLTPAWGFCQEPPLDTRSSRTFRVLPERSRDPRTIRRVLASWFLGPNPLPGLMNPDAPANELSPLETQTIRMILQRPLPNRWPDTDR